MVTDQLRLRLGALQGDSRFGLAPRGGNRPGDPDPASLDDDQSAARLGEMGFRWDRPRGILVRRQIVTLGELGLSSTDLASGRVRALAESLPAEAEPGLLFWDLETTGLQRGPGTVPFLYGWARVSGEGLEVEQWLLPKLGQEGAMVEAALNQIKAAPLLVTYNGSSYDLPLLRTRMVMSGVDRAWPATPHLDLLPLVRRLFRHRLRDCSLRRVEEVLLEQGRQSDLPGREAPERYWEFQRGQDPEVLLEVLAHNRRDLLALPRVVERLLAQLEMREPQATDWLSLGRFVESRGDLAGAEDVYRRALECSPSPLDRAAALRRARLLRRRGLAEEARRAWTEIWTRWRDPEAAEAICVDLEHRQGDLEAALGMARDALQDASVGWDHRFAKRIWRLRSRLGTAAPAPPPPSRDSQGPERPWSGWLPGGESYEAWLALRRGGRGDLKRAGQLAGTAPTRGR